MNQTLPETAHRVFVYGTLRPGGFYHSRICVIHDHTAVPARVRGELFHLDAGYPAVTEGESWVYGDVICFDTPILMREMDALEGFDARRPAEKNLYQRIDTVAFDPETGNALGSCKIYIMDARRVRRMNGIAIPSGVWRPADFGNPSPED